MREIHEPKQHHGGWGTLKVWDAVPTLELHPINSWRRPAAAVPEP